MYSNGSVRRRARCGAGRYASGDSDARFRAHFGDRLQGVRCVGDLQYGSRSYHGSKYGRKDGRAKRRDYVVRRSCASCFRYGGDHDRQYSGRYERYYARAARGGCVSIFLVRVGPASGLVNGASAGLCYHAFASYETAYRVHGYYEGRGREYEWGQRVIL